MRKIFIAILFSIVCYAQNYRGAELRGLEPVLYGKFEARIKPAQGDGMLSSFFTYNDSCCQTSPWNEIDIELLGRYDHVVDFNVITQSSDLRQHYVPFNTHLDFHTYGFEWTPDYVAWFIDGNEVYRQTEEHISGLSYHQKIMMNIWNPTYDDWVGVWDEQILPRFSFYDYVSYASYTPGEGDVGTDSNFTFLWRDDFNFFDSTRWEKKDNHTWGGNQSLFVEENIDFQDGYMILCLTTIEGTGVVDNAVPVALWARQDYDNIEIRFSEELDPASAQETSNYSIAGVSFNEAVINEDMRTVILSMDTDSLNATSMGVFNISDDNDPPNIVDWQVVWIYNPVPLEYILVNNGGDTDGLFLSDQVWGPDKQYGHEGGNYEVIDDSMDIGGTSNDSVYRSSLNRLASYKTRLIPGFYNIKLMFSDNHYSQPGDRIFDVTIEDSLWIDDLDVIAEVGAMSAHEIILERVEVFDGVLDMYFSAEIYGTGYNFAGPFLNGLEIVLDEALQTVSSIPSRINIGKPYPNPFNNQIKIPIEVTQHSRVKIDIIDVRGRVVDTVVDRELSLGKYEFEWNSNLHASGVYIFRATIDKTSYNEKILLLK